MSEEPLRESTTTTATAGPSPAAENRIAAVAVALIVLIGVGLSWLIRQAGEDGAGGSLVALAGVVLTLIVVWRTQRMLGGWREIGLRRPESWPKAIGTGVLVSLVSSAFAYPLLLYVVNPLVGEAPDVSRFDSSRTSLAMMIGTVLTVWVTSALPEEIIWRGFLLTRIAKLAGGARWAWGMALVVTSVHFGLIHFYQGISGVVITGVVGFLYGAAFLLFRRNLWIPIIAHMTSHVTSFTAVYLGLA